MGFLSAHQINCVIQQGKVVKHHPKTRGGELRLCGHKGGVLKQLQWKDKMLYVRYKHNGNHIIILDNIIRNAKEKTQERSHG